MMMNPNSRKLTYFPIYADAINHCAQTGIWAGLVYVTGPTGLGKTAICYNNHFDSYATIFNLLKQIGKKAIFTTHRHNILRDVQEGCTQNKVVYLKSQTDVIKEIVNNENQSVDTFLNGWDAIQAFKHTYIFEGSRRKPLSKQNIREILSQISTMMEKYSDELNNGLLADDFTRKCTQVTNAFKNAIYALLKKVKDDIKELKANKQSARDYKSQIKRLEDKYERLVDSITTNLSVCKLFPYIDFQHNSPAGSVLVSTIDKLVLGFYDIGCNKNITHLEEHVIFMDEFDFLPERMVNALSRVEKIENPLSFIKQFCDLVDKFRKDNEVTQQAWEIVDTLKEEMEQLSIDFPSEYVLTIDKQFFKSRDSSNTKSDESDKNGHLPEKLDAWGYIFDCGYRILSRNFYIKNGDGCLVLTETETHSSIYQFMRIIKHTERKILEFFEELAGSDQKLYYQMIEHCYNKQNDNSKGQNHYHITTSNSLNVYRKHRREKMPFEFEENDQFYMEGFRFSRIIDDPCPGIDNTVHLQQYVIPTTPEGILFRLASRNLVFGMSATIDIERMVNSFDVPWVNGALQRFQPQKPDLYWLDIEDNKEHIANLVTYKNDKRQTALHNLKLAEELSDNTEVVKTLSKGVKFLLHEFNKFHFFEGNENQKQARADRLSRQLETIRWFIEDSERESHIVFTDTFKHLKELFQNKRRLKDFHNKVQKCFGVEESRFKNVYHVTLRNNGK